jgi:hypothetical protein
VADDDLDDDERELVKKHRADKAAKKNQDADAIDWWEEHPEGGRRGATMTAARARSHGPKWLREQLADEDAKPKPEGEGEGEADDQPAKPRKLPYARRAG